MKTITTTQPRGLEVGDFITIDGVHKPDRRWWARFRNWVLRRPPPMLSELQRFSVKSVVGCTASIEEAQNAPR